MLRYTLYLSLSPSLLSSPHPRNHSPRVRLPPTVLSQLFILRHDMLSIHLPFQVLSSTVEVLQNVRTATYVTRLNVHLRGRSLYVRIRQPLASGVAYPAGTAIFVDGFASRPTSSYHLEIVAFRVVATTATDDPRETGHVDMTGIVCNLAQNYCTLVVERSGETSWLVG